MTTPLRRSRPEDRPRSERRLTRDTVIYGIGGSGTQLVYVLFLPIFTRIFRPSDFGVLDFLVAVNGLLGVAALIGLNSALFYFVNQTDDPARRRRLAGTAIGLAVIAGIVIAAIGTIGSGTLSTLLLGRGDEAAAVAMACLWVPANVAATLGLDLLRLEGRPIAYSVLAIGRSAIASILGLVAAGPLGLGVAGLLGAHAITTAAFAALGLWTARRSWRAAIDPAAVRVMLPFGLPLVTFGIALWVIAYSDRFFVIQFLGTAAAGIYSLASRGAGVLTLVVAAFEAAWLPFAMARAREDGHRESYARVFSTVSIGLIGLATFLSLFAREALMLATAPDYVPAYAFVGVLALGAAAYGIGQVVAVGIQLGQRTGQLLRISAAAAVANVGLTIALVPRIGIAGAAIATAVAYTISTGLIYHASRRAYPVDYPVGTVLVASGAAAVAMAAGLVLDAMAPGAAWLPLVTLAKIAIWLAVSMVLLAVLRGLAARTRPTVAIPPPARWPSVTVIVPAWQERGTLEACLASLRTVDYPDWSLVVVAGGADGTFEAARQEAETLPGSVVIDQPPGGKPAALNAGLAVATGEVIVVLDADSRVGPGWLRALVGPIGSEVAASSGRPVPSRRTAVTRVEEMERIAAYDIRGRMVLQGSGSIAIGRETVDAIGGFQPDAYADDWELDARLLLDGEARGYCPDAVVVTERPATLREFWRNELRWRRAHLLSLRRVGDYFLRSPKLVLQNLYPYLAGWLLVALLGIGLGAALVGSAELAGRAGILALASLVAILGQRLTLAIEVATYTGEPRWAREVPTLLGLFLVTLAAGVVASLTMREATLRFKGPRSLGREVPT